MAQQRHQIGLYHKGLEVTKDLGMDFHEVFIDRIELTAVEAGKTPSIVIV